MAHTEQSIIAEIKKALKEPATLYKQPFAKRYGHMQRLSEIASRELLHRFNQGQYKIPIVCRKEGYYIPCHAELAKQKRPPNTNQTEKWDARAMFGHTFAGIGEIIDFETPLYTAEDKSAGAIDLLAYDRASKTLTILEYKRQDTPEPLLRCVLEAYTYGQLVNKERLPADFSESCFKVSAEAKIRAAVFVHENSIPHKHYLQAPDTEIRKLMQALGVDLITIAGE